jgi:hypothetical protein
MTPGRGGRSTGVAEYHQERRYAGDRGRQSLTTPRWGGLLLARPAGPQCFAVPGRTAWPARTHQEARLIQLSFEDFEAQA